MKVLDTLLVILEKLLSLVTSQRAVTAGIGVLLVVALAGQVLAVINGEDEPPLPTDQQLEALVVQALANFATFLSAAIAIIGLLRKLIGSITESPPNLRRDTWYIR